MNTFGSVKQRTNVVAAKPDLRGSTGAKPLPAKMSAPSPAPGAKMSDPDPRILPTSSMQLTNRAGQTGPVPVKGIVNGLVKRG
jgi:hypothetical protein